MAQAGRGTRGVRRTAVALMLAALVSAGCDDQPQPPETAPSDDPGWATPEGGFCDALVTEAGITAEVEERLDGDEEDLTAVCVINTARMRVDMGVRVSELASRQYEHTSEERAAGAVGFPEPVVSAPEGWWSRGVRYEAVYVESVRLFDLLQDDDLVVTLQLVGEPASGDPTQRQGQARDTADALDAAVASVLEG